MPKRTIETDNPGPSSTPAAIPLRPALFGRLRAYFFAGVLVTAPIGITIYLAWSVVTWIDESVLPFIPAKYNPETYLPFSLPGIGLVVLLVFLTAIGAITAGMVGRMVVGYGERILSRMPVIRSVYSATKQVFETMLAKRSTAFREVVLVEFPRPGMWSIGFITGVTEGEVQELTDEEVLNVYIPTTPNPTSGYLCFVARSEVYPLSMSVEEGIKMVVSGGLVIPPDRRPPEERKKPPPIHARLAGE
ncbi:MAG: DUF502 domain-containing protein [Dongiaceae bacterium]